jgi:tetratricopeptide (TPR) repeat protein
MISMSPFFEVAEVAEVGEMRRTANPYENMGAPIPEDSTHLFGYSELTNRTAPDARQAAVAKNQEATQVQQSLNEVDYYLQQGLYEDARIVLDNLARAYPNNALVQQRRSEFEASFQDDQMVDDATGAQAGAGSPFEIGLAYRERGMVDEAIREFQTLIGTGIGDAICYHLIGVCFGDKGRYPEAIDAFKRALHIGGLSFEDELGIYYALGATHEAIGDRNEAVYYYQRVYQRDPQFRDITQRIQQLQRTAQKKSPSPPNRNQESGASPLPIRRDQGPAQAIARSRDDDDRYS